MRKCLFIIDVQYDFLPGGSLGVNEGFTIIPEINDLIKNGDYKYIILTQDWHSKNHCSFRENGGNWPPHCIANTHGSEIEKNIMETIKTIKNKLDKINEPEFIFIKKGKIDSQEEYSPLDGNNGLQEFFTENRDNIDQIDVCGIAYEYCCAETSLSIKRFLPEKPVNFLIYAIKGVTPLDSNTTKEANKKLIEANVKLVKSK